MAQERSRTPCPFGQLAADVQPVLAGIPRAEDIGVDAVDPTPLDPLLDPATSESPCGINANAPCYVNGLRDALVKTMDTIIVGNIDAPFTATVAIVFRNFRY